MIIYIPLIITMTLIASFASFFLKKSTGANSVLSIIKSKFLYIGGFMYVLAALFNMWLLQKLDYSIVVPLGSICYIWTLIIAAVFLKEKINIGKIIGISLILIGVVCISV